MGAHPATARNAPNRTDHSPSRRRLGAGWRFAIAIAPMNAPRPTAAKSQPISRADPRYVRWACNGTIALKLNVNR